MSWALVLVVLGFILYLFSQFGSKLAAKGSFAWWGALAFLALAAIRPTLLEPLAHALGMQLVSNFVFAAMIFFLVFQAIQEGAFSTAVSRKVRELTCNRAARDFLATRHSAPAANTSTRALVIMPCLNEENALPGIIVSIRALTHESSELGLDFCVVNDGSSDGTEEILVRELPGAFVTHGANVGVSGALLTGFRVLKLAPRETGYDFVVQCDSDGQHPIDRIPDLVLEARRRGTDLLIGSRYLDGPAGRLRHPSTTPARRLGGRIMSAALRVFSIRRGWSVRFTDPTSGFRVYSRSAALYLASRMPDEFPEVEAIALLGVAGAKIQEVPVEMSARNSGVSSLSGVRGAAYMLKVLTALFGLRLRAFVRRREGLVFGELR